MSARRCIISVLATHPIAHRLACLPHVHQSRGRLRLLALTTGVLVPICSTVNPPHPFRPHSPRLIDTGNGENDGADYSRAWCGRSVCLSLRLCGIGGRRRPFYRLAVPSPFLLGGLWLIACVPASRSSLRPIRYDRRGGGYGASRCSLGGASDGANGFIVNAMRLCRCLPHACLGSPAAVPFFVSLSQLSRSHTVLSLACSRHARLSISPRHPTRETGSGTGRVLARW